MIKAPFTKSDVEMSDEEFEIAVNGLIDKGMAEKIIIDNEIHYMITDLGLEIGSHLDSDPSNQN
jgi:hypothetical protein